MLDFQNSNLEILPEPEFRFCRVDQNNKCHLFAFNIMNQNSCSFTAIFNCEGYLVIYNKVPIIIQIPSGKISNRDDTMDIPGGSLKVTVNEDRSTINIRDAFRVRAGQLARTNLSARVDLWASGKPG